MAIETTSDLSLVGTSQIVDGSVTSAKIGTGAVVAASIAAGAVGSAALASGAVGSAAIAAASVGTAAISSGAATSGQVLQANGSGAVAFATPAAGGGMTLIATATPSAATTISFTSIPSTYKNLVLIWHGMFQSTTTGYWGIRLNNDTSTAYTFQGVSTLNTTVSINWLQSSGTSFGGNDERGAPIGLTATSGSDLNATSKGSMTIYRYTDTGNRLVEWSSTGQTSGGLPTYVSANGIYKPAAGSAVSQIDFIRNSTQTITGTAYLYGVS